MSKLRILSTILIIVCINKSSAQIEEQGYYEIVKNGSTIYQCPIGMSDTDLATNFSSLYQDFPEVGDYFVLEKIITINQVQYARLNFNDDPAYPAMNGREYLMSVADIELCADFIEPTLKLSEGVIPLKIRLKPANLSTEVSLGTCVVWTPGSGRFSRNFSFFSGLSPFVVNYARNNGGEVTTSAEPSMTFLGGLSINTKDFGVIIAAGADYIMNANYRDWTHQGDLWIGFGLGFNWVRISKKISDK